MIWRTSKREIVLDRPLVMAVLNLTPDSFSDGGSIASVDDALRQAEKFVDDGADIIDIGGESTRPGSSRVSVEEETLRVVSVIEAITKRFDIPISVDTSKSEVAAAAIGAGAEIINDISALRFDRKIGEVAALNKTGLILMHSLGDFETMHTQKPVPDIMTEVLSSLRDSVEKAKRAGVADDAIALDIGIGFGKTQEQNLELIAKLDRLTSEFPGHPFVVGTSRKSFIGRILDGADVSKRLSGSLVTAAVAVWNGAKIVRVHDVKETAETLRIVEAIKSGL